MSLQNFEILNKIGEGAYSIVHKVHRKSDGVVYALKKVRFVSLSEKEKENAVNEIRILASISHPNIIGYKEAFIDQASNNLCLIIELADGGDLLQKITQTKQRRDFFHESEIWQIFIQTLRGLKCLHDLNILHRDLKCANVYLFKNGCIKLGDMNVSKVAKLGLVYTQTGTPYYASPEVWKDRPYDSKSDIWSLGCVLYEVAALNPPFQANDMQGLYKKVICGDYPALPLRYSQDLSKLISMLLKVDPRKRPSCNELLSHPLVIKHCQTQEPENIESNLLSTIKVPKQMSALAGSLPSSNYSQKISKKFPEAFRHGQSRILSEQYLKSRSGEDFEEDKKIEKCKRYSDLTPVAVSKGNYEKANIRPLVQYEKGTRVLPPIKNSYNRGSVKPSWWG